ncbi:MAG TPA: DUF3102 domain-containing protein [Verrucomicrobiae bacterium]|nr:DUF3102 domain-containing protein [Verrucomicrobiae bacterium]
MKTTTKEKTKRLNVTADQSNQLKKLAREIRQLYTNTNALVRSAQEKGRAAIAEAILCGQKLNEAKKIVGHGGWMKWLKQHCKGVHFNTASRYMRLANSSHVVNLKDFNSLRQAYIGVGIIEDSEPETTSGHTSSLPSDTREHIAAAGENNSPSPDSSNGEQSTGALVEPLAVAPRAGFLAPVNIGRVAKDTAAERIKRIRQLTVSLETEIKSLPKAHHAEARRIVGKLVAFVGEKAKSKAKR